MTNTIEINGETYIKQSDVTPEYKEGLHKQSQHPFKIGEKYFIRTVTMHLVGKLEKVFENELVLSGAAWVADSGRFYNALNDGEKALDEVEPFIDDVIIGRGALIDMTKWNHNILKNVFRENEFLELKQSSTFLSLLKRINIYPCLYHFI